MNKYRKTIGILLVGGESRRYGGEKAFARFNNNYLFQHSFQILTECCDEVVIISHPRLKSRIEDMVDVKVIEDIPIYRGLGPLAGIYSGMKEMCGDWYVVLPCDTPKMEQSIIKTLLNHRDDDLDAVIPVIKNRLQPLIGVYSAHTEMSIKKLLDQNVLKMTALLEECNVLYLKEDVLGCSEEHFKNINFFTDLENLS
ncbi:molybdenum cofactor guanylyltransferase [Litchfieldia salsa]|nr:molybdenum cofactor guanylyltransferase [Litchfieldia salsa]